MSANTTTERSRRSGSLPSRRQIGRAVAMLCLGTVAILVPFVGRPAVLWLLGVVVVTAGVLQILQGFDRREGASRRSSFYSGGMSLAIGGLLFLAPLLVASGLALLLGGSLILDGCSRLSATWRNRSERGSRPAFSQ